MRTEIDPRMTKARSKLVLKQPFFGTLALHLQIIEDESVGTMATDGKRLWYAPAFLDKNSEPEIEGVVAHEVMHCAYRHQTRRQNRDPELWNKAADYAVNRDLLAAGFTLPASRLYDKRFGDLGAEDIYKILHTEEQSKPKSGAGKPGQQGQGDGTPGSGEPQFGKGADVGGTGVFIDPTDENGNKASPGEIAAEDAKWETRVRQALNVAAAAQAGKVPGSLKRLSEATEKAKIDWREVLRRFIDGNSKGDYSWMRPNKRLLNRGFVLPSMVPDSVKHLGFGFDTSGSIWGQPALINKMAAEIQAALDEGNVDKITVVYCDTRVTGVETFERGDLIRLNARGGGGTYFSPVFEWFNANADDITALVYLTDLECSDFGPEPAYPVMWAAYGDPHYLPGLMARVPFGECMEVAD